MENKMNKICLYILVNMLFWPLLHQNSFATDADTILSTDEIYDTIVQRLNAGSFDEVDKILSGHLISKKLTVDGKRRLEEIYEKFDSFHDENVLNAWCEKSKTIHFPYVIRGSYYLKKAHETRGSEYARNVKDKQWNDIKIFLQKAQADLEKAYSITPSDPYSASRMVGLCLLKRYPREIMDKWFSRAIEADSFWFKPYVAKLSYIMPWWYGSQKEVEEFYKDCFEKSPKGSAIYSIVFKYINGAVNIQGSIVQVNMRMSNNLTPEILKMTTDGIKRFRQDFPDSIIPDYYEGLYHQYQKNFEEALTYYEKALQKKPDNRKALEAKIVAILFLGQREKAEIELNKFIKKYPDSPFALTNLGVLQFSLHNNIEKGIELFSKAIAIEADPSYQKMYYFYLGTLLHDKGKYDQAINFFTKTLEIDPYFSKALLGRGASKHDSGDLDGAVEDLLIVQQQNNVYSEGAKNSLKRYSDERAQGKSLPHQSPKAPVVEAPLIQDIQTADIKQNRDTVPPQRVSKEDLEQQFNNCENFYFRKMKNEATDCFSSLIQAAPDYAAPYYMLGQIAVNLEYDFGKSINYFGTAVSKDPKNEQYILSFGKSLYMVRQFEQAIAVFTKIIETNSSNGEAYYQRGLCFDATGQEEQAIQDMQLAGSLGPMIEEARRYVDKHAKREVEKPKMSKIDQLIILADDNYRLRRFTEAEEQYKEIIKLNPKHDISQFQLGLLYRERDNDNKKALTQFDKAIKINAENPDYFLTRGMTLRASGKCDLAIKDFSKALLLKPNNGVTYSERATCYEKLGELKKAEDDFLATLKYTVGNKDYYYSRLADITVKTGTPLEINSNNAMILVKRGLAYKSRNEYDLSKNDFLRAIELNPSLAASYFELGVLYFEKLKNTEDALANLDKAIEREQGNRNYFFQRGQVYHQLKDFAKAKNDYSKVIELSSHDGQALYYRGDCNNKLGLKDLAIDDLLKAKQYNPEWTQSVDTILAGMK